MRFTQVLVGAAPGDAVTRCALEIDRMVAPVADTAIRARYIDPAVSAVIVPLDAPEHGPPASDDDVVVLHVSIGEPDVSRWLGDRPERLAVVYHNISPAASFEDHDPAFADLLRLGRAELPTLAGRSELTLADSEFNATELRHVGFADVRVCPLVFDPGALDSAGPSTTTVRHLREVTTGPVILFVGQLLPHKRVDWLLQAYFILVTYLLPEAHLIMVGPAPLPGYHRVLQDFANELNLDRAWIAGRVSDADLAAFYRRADVVATASEHEGFCAPLLEAMAFGAPLVARRFAAIPETLGDAGVLVEADDPPAVFAEALFELTSEPGCRLGRTLADRGRQRLQTIGPGPARAILRRNLAELVPGLEGTPGKVES
ncbi:MAG: glycosyltransferase [Actinomycetota bacterium]|nr:glycosyltransferase [Actinomycetota bacterium]